MKTPYTLHFNQASAPLVAVGPRPFVPQYALPFVSDDASAYYRGEHCRISYRWHDAFDVYIAVLEARMAAGLCIPVDSHLPDLYLVYQLQGETRIVPNENKYPKAQPVTLPEGKRVEVYAPPARATLELKPNGQTLGYAAAAVVPKSGWVTRHPKRHDSPMESLITILKQEYDTHHYLHPSPITPSMQAWLHILLSTPPGVGMRLDDALNRSMVRLLEEHQKEYRLQALEKPDVEFIDGVRLLVRELVHRMEDGVPPTAETAAKTLKTSAKRIQSTHYRAYNKRFDHYIFACRIEEAKQRLLTDFPVSAIAYQLGWNDHANFSRDFKKHSGLTPTAYRGQYRAGIATRD